MIVLAKTDEPDRLKIEMMLCEELHQLPSAIRREDARTMNEMAMIYAIQRKQAEKRIRKLMEGKG